MKRLLIFLKRNWKNATVVTVSLSIIAGSLVYLNQTNAYLVDNTPQKANTFSTYEVDISVVYKQTDNSYVEGDIFENATETGGTISDGMDLDKNVHIRNDGDLPCYVRVIPTFNYVNDRADAWYFDSKWWSGVRVYLADAPKAEDGTNADGSTYKADYSVEYNTTDWLLDENTGILYYTKPLQPKEVTTYIFSDFAIPGGVGNHENYTVNNQIKQAHFTIDVSADAIQCERADNMAETSIPAVCTRWGVTLENGKAEGAIVAVPPANFYHLDNNNTLGMTFDSKPYYQAESKFTSQIKTFEATVLLPNGYAGRGGVIMGTYNGTNDQGTVNFELGSADSRYYDCPRIYVANSSGTYEYIFTSVHLADGKWHHVAMTWDGTQMFLYVDGEQRGSKNGTAYSSIVPNRNIAVAGDYRSGNSEYFKGMIRNVTLYSDVRTAAEIQADVTRSVYNPDPDNILASYNLADFAGGTSIADVSGKGNELFITN